MAAHKPVETFLVKSLVPSGVPGPPSTLSKRCSFLGSTGFVPAIVCVLTGCNSSKAKSAKLRLEQCGLVLQYTFA